MLSILGILVAAQQVAVLTLLGVPSASRASGCIRHYRPLLLAEVGERESNVRPYSEGNSRGIWRPRWKMVFIWQCPMMFMSYSVCFFLAGSTLYVCTPLIRGAQWSEGVNVSRCFLFDLLFGEEADFNGLSKIAVVYLAVVAIAGSAFLVCAFWIYHYIDLDSISEEQNEEATGDIE